MNREEFEEHVQAIEEHIKEVYPVSDEVRFIDEISRAEWIVWMWCDVTCFGDKYRTYIRGQQRSIHEAAKAAAQYDIWTKARKEVKHDTN